MLFPCDQADCNNHKRDPDVYQRSNHVRNTICNILSVKLLVVYLNCWIKVIWINDVNCQKSEAEGPKAIGTDDDTSDKPSSVRKVLPPTN